MVNLFRRFGRAASLAVAGLALVLGAAAARPASAGEVILSVASGPTFSCGIFASSTTSIPNPTMGTVKCWGPGLDWALGQTVSGSAATPMSISGVDARAVYKAVAVGGYHACALAWWGAVSCWGTNYLGQVGNGATTFLEPAAKSVVGLENDNVAQISAGLNHTCAVTQAGAVKCWGAKLDAMWDPGQARRTATLVPTLDGQTEAATAVAAGVQHDCALTSAGAVKCWGVNSSYQLGTGSTDAGFMTSVPVSVASLPHVLALAAGQNQACAVTDWGTVRCWGAVSIGPPENMYTQYTAVPIEIPDIIDPSRVSLGDGFGCALIADGTVKCWGLLAIRGNDSGNLPEVYGSSPIPVPRLAGAIGLGAGGGHACAVLAGGAAQCWGGPWWSTTRDGDYHNSAVDAPVHVYRLTALAAGFAHTCMATDTSVQCWGDNGGGDLGFDPYTSGVGLYSLRPLTVPGLYGATALAAGGATCAIARDGVLRCWGRNSYGSVGDGTTGRHPAPAVISPFDGVSGRATAVAAGAYHTCALNTAGELWCWGGNFWGQLGDGTTIERHTPIRVPIYDSAGQPTPVISVVAGAAYTCALTGFERQVLCWGGNTYGQLGDGTTQERHTPSPVPGYRAAMYFTPMKLIGTSGHACVVVASMYSRDLACWGGNWSGQVGDGTQTNRPSPVWTRNLGNTINYSDNSPPSFPSGAGNNLTCAASAARTIKCWGRVTVTLSSGQGPVLIGGVDVPTGLVTDIAAGNYHACAAIDGRVRCWGGNGFGQLGNGSITETNTAVHVSGIP